MYPDYETTVIGYGCEAVGLYLMVIYTNDTGIDDY